MAKQQRRPPPRSGKPDHDPTTPRVQRSADMPLSARRPAQPAQASGPQRRSTYFEAVAVYERGLEALQRHAYSEAANLLESVLRQYPEEKELHERVRLYLNIWNRQATQLEANPQTIGEPLYARTLAINGGHD